MIEFLWRCLFNLILTCSLEEKSALGYLENPVLGIIIFSALFIKILLYIIT